jgi:hypothetical protein
MKIKFSVLIVNKTNKLNVKHIFLNNIFFLRIEIFYLILFINFRNKIKINNRHNFFFSFFKFKLAFCNTTSKIKCAKLLVILFFVH